MHSNGTSRLPPGLIFMEHARTRGMPEVVSGSSITMDPLDHIIFCVPSCVQMMPMKFMAVKSVPRSFHVPTNYKRLSEWLTIDSESTGYLS